MLCQLADYYNVSLDWLLTGTQPALQETVLSDAEKELLTSLRHLTQENRLKIQGMIELKLHEQRTENVNLTTPE